MNFRIWKSMIGCSLSTDAPLHSLEQHHDTINREPSTRRSVAKEAADPLSLLLPTINTDSSINIDEVLKGQSSYHYTPPGSVSSTRSLTATVTFDWDRDVPAVLGDSFVRHDSSGNVVSGTLRGLTELLLNSSSNDLDFKTYREVFMYSYKSFNITGLALLQLLLHQCGGKLRSANVEQQIALYYTLGTVLQLWLDTHDFDVNDQPLLQRMKEVAVFLQLKLNTSDRFKKLVHVIDEHCNRLVMPLNEPQSPSALADLTTAPIEISPKLLSKVLMVVFTKSYQKVKRKHYMEYIYDDSNEDNPVNLFLNDCKKLKFWVKKAILRPHSHIERTSNLEYFLTAVQECRLLGNYACARTMLNGISDFTTLKRTFGNLNRKMSEKIFKKEDNLLSEPMYWVSIGKVNQCIPCLSIHIREMKRTSKAADDNFREGPGLINFEKYREINACISKLPVLKSSSLNDVDDCRTKQAIELVLAQLHNITVNNKLEEWIRRRSVILQKDELADYEARRHELDRVGFRPMHTSRRARQADTFSVLDHAPFPPMPHGNPFDRHSPLCLNGQITDISSRAVDGGGNADIFTGQYDGQKVAIKSLRPWSAHSTISEARLLHRIRREYITWTWVSHPLVLPCLGYYFFDPNRDLPALVSPWMAQGSFKGYATNLDGSKCLKVLVEVAEGLCYLHENFQPIVHGDIRAGNILISNDGRPCLSDFGLSTVLRQESLTATTEHAGSLAWMSPELLQQQAVPALPTTYSDVWAYAMTVLEIMTGRQPYSPIEAPAALIDMISHMKLPPRPLVMKVSATVSDQIWSLCLKCWKADPQQRLTMSEVYQIMRRIHH